MKKIKVREVLLLIIPVVALGVFAWRSKMKTAPIREAQREPSSVYIDEIKVEKATPREVYEGYDTRVIVEHSKIPPQLNGFTYVGGDFGSESNPKIFSRKNGKWHPIMDSSKSRLKYVTVFGHTSYTKYQMKLHDIPLSVGELKLKTRILGSASYNGAPGIRRGMTIKLKPADVWVTVRRAGEKIAQPQPSKYRPFRVKRIAMEKLELGWDDGSDHNIVLVLENIDGVEQFANKFDFINPRLIDARGKEVSFNPQVIGANRVGVNLWFPAQNGPHGDTPTSCTRWFRIPLRLIPKSAGRVTFKTEVSYDDGWPLPVEIVLRDNKFGQ